MIASLGWGFSQYLSRQSLETRIEGYYTRAFEELGYHTNGIEIELSKALVAGSREKIVQFMNAAGNHVRSAQEELGMLPISLVPLDNTERLLARLADETFSLTSLASSGGDIDEDVRVKISQLLDGAELLNRKVQQMRQDFRDRGISWIGLDQVLLSQAGAPQEATGRSVAKDFAELEDGLRRLPGTAEGPELKPFEKPEAEQGPTRPVTESDSLAIAKDFLGAERIAGKSVTVSGRSDGKIPAYSVQVTPGPAAPEQAPQLAPSPAPAPGTIQPTEPAEPARPAPTAPPAPFEPASEAQAREQISLNVSRKTGNVVWMLSDTAPPESRIDPEAAERTAAKFLADRGYLDMVPIARQIADNQVTVTYVFQMGDIRVYPDQVKVTVSLADGRVSGFDALGYLTFHRERAVILPRLSQMEAEAKVSPNLNVTARRLAIVLNEKFEEVLAYEFEGTMRGDHYRVFINALTGREEKVERVR